MVTPAIYASAYIFFGEKITYIISLKSKPVIHVGISSKTWKLVLDVATLANACATSFACLLIKLDTRVC